MRTVAGGTTGGGFTGATGTGFTGTTAGLAATEDRAERIKPDDESLLRAIETNRIVRFTMRDGELVLGRVRSFGRWDAEVCIETGEIVTVFFHGLHAVSKTLGYTA